MKIFSMIFVVLSVLSASTACPGQNQLIKPTPIDTPATGKSPGRELDESLRKPVEWVECPLDAGWWDRLWNCRECSPGQWEGTHCFTVDDLDARASCGSTISLSNGTSSGVSLQVNCPGGTQVRVTRSWFSSITWSFPTGPCQTCEARICYMNSAVRVWECSRTVPDRWHYETDAGQCRLRIVDSWRVETYYTTEFIPGDPPTITPYCWSTPCFCKDQGQVECSCDEEDPQQEAPAKPIDELSVVALDRPLSRDLSASIEVGQFVSANDPRSRGQVVALSDLSVVELRALVSAVTGTWDRLWQEADFDDERVQINLVFENGTVLTGRPTTILDAISSATNTVRGAFRNLDINNDGGISYADREALLSYIEASQEGRAYPSHADFNADGFVSYEDVKMFEEILSARHKQP